MLGREHCNSGGEAGPSIGAIAAAIIRWRDYLIQDHLEEATRRRVRVCRTLACSNRLWFTERL
jgi:hypothetical protein